MNPIAEFPTATFSAGSFRLPVRIYYEDTDTLGMVYHANYLKYMERARVEWLRAVGVFLPEVAEQERGAFVVRRINIEYLRPAKLGDALDATVRVKSVKGCSVDLRQTVEDAGGAYTQADVQIAYVNIDKMRAAAMPQALRQGILSSIEI